MAVLIGGGGRGSARRLVGGGQDSPKDRRRMDPAELIRGLKALFWGLRVSGFRV